VLKFSKANRKTEKLYGIPELRRYLKNGRKVYSLDLLAGWSCPGADGCLSKCHVGSRRRLTDGPNCRFRCYAASQEVAYPALYNLHKHNLQCIKKMRGIEQCCGLLNDCLPQDLGILRFHSAGDFFKPSYLMGAIALAEKHPDKLFYAYTKSLHFMVDLDMLEPEIGKIRHNFLITASEDGKYDHLISKLNMRSATVIFSPDDADFLEIDQDDSHASTPGPSFALLLHGVQPKGSDASKALQLLKG
jgi:hypothetical protein